MEGPVGPKGPTGAQGITGPRGAQGFPGPMGPVGPQGLTGPDGRQGLMGFPNPSVPVGVQIFTTTSTVEISTPDERQVLFTAMLDTGRPSLVNASGRLQSTTISGMSLDPTTGVITVPAGRYLVEAACSFPTDVEVITGSISLVDTLLSDTIILEGNLVGSSIIGTKGMTSFMSSFVNFDTNGSVKLSYNVARVNDSLTKSIPLVDTSSIAVFVTFVKV